MSTLFLALICVHVAQSLVSSSSRPENTRRKLRLNLLVFVQFCLFVLAASYALRQGALSRSLLSPVMIGAGLLGGHLIFGVSLLLTHGSLEDARGHFFNWNGLFDFLADHPYVLARFIFVGVSEEVIWRAAALPLADGAIGPLPALVLVSLGFCVVHDHFFKNSRLVSLEFVGFSLLVGAMYLWTGSLILVVLIHALRDIEIAHLEYIIKVNELGDEAQAAREIEKEYRPRLKGHAEP